MTNDTVSKNAKYYHITDEGRWCFAIETEEDLQSSLKEGLFSTGDIIIEAKNVFEVNTQKVSSIIVCGEK